MLNADTPANRHMAVPLNLQKAEQIAKAKQQAALTEQSAEKKYQVQLTVMMQSNDR